MQTGSDKYKLSPKLRKMFAVHDAITVDSQSDIPAQNRKWRVNRKRTEQTKRQDDMYYNKNLLSWIEFLTFQNMCVKYGHIFMHFYPHPYSSEIKILSLFLVGS